MSIRKTNLVENEFYHVYNRGVDKREIFQSQHDYRRFLEGVVEFNNIEPIGSLYENTFKKKTAEQLGSPASKLVEVTAYCLNPNHFHLILKQNTEKGIEKFIQRLCTSYSKYFNNKNHRSGSLFQGRFKSSHIDNNEYLLYLSAYVNLNNKIHRIENEDVFSSLQEYTEDINGICGKTIILDQFKNKEEYAKFLESSTEELMRQKDEKRSLERYLIEEED